MGAEQIPLQLGLTEPYALKFFVPHRGVGEALQSLKEALGRPDQALISYIWGPPGSGASHLAFGIAAQAKLDGRTIIRIVRGEHVYDAERNIVAPFSSGEFVSLNEAIRREAGVLLTVSSHSPQEFSQDPHVSSRILSGLICRISYPDETELAQVIQCVAERCNLRLSERSIAVLKERLPRDVLSFHTILANISELALRENRRVSEPYVRKFLEESGF